jgi:hypothetical protein
MWEAEQATSCIDQPVVDEQIERFFDRDPEGDHQRTWNPRQLRRKKVVHVARRISCLPILGPYPE